MAAYFHLDSYKGGKVLQNLDLNVPLLWQNCNTAGWGVKLVSFGCCRYPGGGINVAGIKGSSIPFIEVNNIYYTPLYPVHTRLKLQPAEHLVFNSSSSFCNVLEKHLVARYADFSSRYSHWSGGCPFSCKFFTLPHLHLIKIVWFKILNWARWPESPDFECTPNTS